MLEELQSEDKRVLVYLLRLFRFDENELIVEELSDGVVLSTHTVEIKSPSTTLSIHLENSRMSVWAVEFERRILVTELAAETPVLQSSRFRSGACDSIPLAFQIDGPAEGHVERAMDSFDDAIAYSKRTEGRLVIVRLGPR